MAQVRNDDTLGPRFLVLVLAGVLIIALALLVTGPEPCTDGTGSTACASAPRTAP